MLDHHTRYVVLAVQGTRSDEVLDAIGFPSGHDYMSFVEAEFEDTGVVVCRTGYTGERGYELIALDEVAGALWDRLLEAGAPFGMLPCGLGARDTLRTEMGYPLHGQDITLDVTPNQAGLGWAVGWKKDAFWGKDALVAEKEAGPKRRLRGLVALERGIPRPGHAGQPDSRRPALRDHLRHLLPDAEEGDRDGSRADLRRPRGRARRPDPDPARDLPLPRLPVRRHLGAGVMNLPEQPATFRQPTPSERPWWWRLHDAAGTDALAPEEYADQRFASQADAESWVGEVWAELAAAGVTR